MDDKERTGRNIRKARNEKKLTQRALSQMTEISQTQLSDYENGNKMPGLISLSKIANSLGKSIDELFWGDASESPISSAPDIGRLVANCVYELWDKGVIRIHIPSEDEIYAKEYACVAPMVDLGRHAYAVNRLLETLDDFKERKHTYRDPDAYLEQVLDSTATEISSHEN